ncbi:putative ABC transporter ATP-binding protein, partial [Haemophilus influenzae]
AYFTQ